MKKVILILPDKINHKLDASKFTKKDEVETTRKGIIKMLSERLDYHEDYYFKNPDEIKILSIEEIE